MADLNFTGNVRRLRIRPGDTIVLEATEHIDAAIVGDVIALMRERYPDNECLVMGGGFRLAAVLKPDEEACVG